MVIQHSHIFTSGSANASHPRVLFSGAVHGNEPMGVIAINRLLKDLYAGSIRLKSGTLECIPIANPPAFALGKRHTGHDMNRNLGGEPFDEYRNALCRAIESCDTYIDIHSLYSSLVSFAYLGPYSKAERELALSLGVKNFIEGWEDAYKNAYDSAGNIFPIKVNQSAGTTEYARKHGATALTLECGRHDDPQAPHVAFRAMLGVLDHVGMIDDLSYENQRILATHRYSADEVSCVLMDRVVYQTKDGVLVDGLQNFQPIKKGELIARNNDGTTITAHRDGLVIMPDDRMTKAPQDPRKIEEWFYTGTRSRLIPA